MISEVNMVREADALPFVPYNHDQMAGLIARTVPH